MSVPTKPLILKDGLRIDFRTDDGEPLRYIRFEDNQTGRYLGFIDEKPKLLKLRKAIDALLGQK